MSPLNVDVSPCSFSMCIAFHNWSHNFQKESTNVSLQTFVILLSGMLSLPIMLPFQGIQTYLCPNLFQHALPSSRGHWMLRVLICKWQ